LIAVIVGIRLFSALMSAADLAHAASMELANAGIPAIFVIALLPFISGIVTGVGMGYVGLSLPIVLGLLASSDIPFKAGVVIARSLWLFRDDALAFARVYGGDCPALQNNPAGDNPQIRAATGHFSRNCDCVYRASFSRFAMSAQSAPKRTQCQFDEN
jgi:hypothetical protein